MSKLKIEFGIPLIFILLIGCQTSSQDLNDSFIKVRRPNHYFRHFVWSGIFPFGGRIPDPHILASRVYDGGPSLAEALGAKKVRYQIFDINPYFTDETTEYILAIETDGLVFEYRIDLNARSKARTIVSDDEDNAAIFPTKNDLILYLDFYQTDLSKEDEWSNLARIELPLSNKKSSLKLFSAKSPHYQTIVSEISKQLGSEYRREFCGGTNPKRAFFTRYFGPCQK